MSGKNKTKRPKRKFKMNRSITRGKIVDEMFRKLHERIKLRYRTRQGQVVGMTA